MLARREKQSESFYRFATLLTITAPLPAQLHRAIAGLEATTGGVTVLDDHLAAHTAALPLARFYRPRRRLWR